MRPAQIASAAADFDVPVNSAIDMRLVYLLGMAKEWQEYMAQLTNKVPEMALEAVKQQIEMLHRYEMNPNVPDGRLSDEMIAAAMEYPIDKLIDFNGSGKAFAFCHCDKQPSLHYYRAKNKAWCWPCNKGFSTIEVLMERDGMSFVDAVKFLQ